MSDVDANNHLFLPFFLPFIVKSRIKLYTIQIPSFFPSTLSPVPVKTKPLVQLLRYTYPSPSLTTTSKSAQDVHYSGHLQHAYHTSEPSETPQTTTLPNPSCRRTSKRKREKERKTTPPPSSQLIPIQTPKTIIKEPQSSFLKFSLINPYHPPHHLPSLSHETFQNPPQIPC